MYLWGTAKREEKCYYIPKEEREKKGRGGKQRTRDQEIRKVPVLSIHLANGCTTSSGITTVNTPTHCCFVLFSFYPQKKVFFPSTAVLGKMQTNKFEHLASVMASKEVHAYLVVVHHIRLFSRHCVYPSVCPPLCVRSTLRVNDLIS